MKIVKLIQEDYDDGIQLLHVYCDTGDVVTQEWEWPEIKYRGHTSTNPMHDLFDDLFDMKMNPNDIYFFIQKYARLKSGRKIEAQ